MKILTNESQWHDGRTAIAFGVFDGIHLGHRALIKTVCEIAESKGIQSVIYTFDPHPLEVLFPERRMKYLQTREEKISDFESLGVDALILRPFDKGFASIAPTDFVTRISSHLSPLDFVVGFNYTFGAGGAGNPSILKDIATSYGIDTTIVDKVIVEGDTVSSTRTRNAIEHGDMRLARALLGRPYSLSGKVVSGKQLGRTMGFPTANLDVGPRKLLPCNGVYACWAYVFGERYKAVVNIGKHPTLPEGPGTIEAFLMDYHGDMFYSADVQLEIIDFIRPEQKFESVQALEEEIARNCKQADVLLDAELVNRNKNVVEIKK